MVFRRGYNLIRNLRQATGHLSLQVGYKKILRHGREFFNYRKYILYDNYFFLFRCTNLCNTREATKLEDAPVAAKV